MKDLYLKIHPQMYCCRNQMTSKRKIQKIEMKPGIFLICCFLRGLWQGVTFFFWFIQKVSFLNKFYRKHTILLSVYYETVFQKTVLQRLVTQVKFVLKPQEQNSKYYYQWLARLKYPSPPYYIFFKELERRTRYLKKSKMSRDVM